MTDDTQNDVNAAKAAAAAPAGEAPAGAVAADDPMAKAIAGGYVEEPAPGMRERVETLVASFEHAMAHNAPVTPAMLNEMKAILLGNE